MYKVIVKLSEVLSASRKCESLEEAKKYYYAYKSGLPKIESIQIIYITDDDIKLIKYDGRVE